jgi:hypothetical protein
VSFTNVCSCLSAVRDAFGSRNSLLVPWTLLRKNKVTLVIDLNDSREEKVEAEKHGFRHIGLKMHDLPESSEELLPILHA